MFQKYKKHLRFVLSAMVFLTLGLAILGTDVSAVAINLVINPSFENGEDNWYELGSATATNIVTPGANNTAKTLQIGIAEGGTGQIITGVTGGESYTLSGCGKVSVKGEISHLGIDCRDSNGKKLAGGKFSVKFRDTDFMNKQCTFTTVPGTTQLQVFTYKNEGPGNAYVDEICLVKNEK